jgi:D-lyxose ketol-isomerase
MKASDIHKLQKRTLQFLKKAHVVYTPSEARAIEVADMGLSMIDEIGLEVLLYENNDRYCAKELILFPRQTCPEHRHPPMDAQNIGKRETFRCRWGLVYLYIEGPPVRKPKARVPKARKDHFTVFNEIILKPGDQFTIPPNTLHWFQAGPAGAVVSEFSSTSHDETDVFTDPLINRLAVMTQ